MCLKDASCFGKCSTKLTQRLGVQVLSEFIGFLVMKKDTWKDCQMNSSPGFETDNQRFLIILHVMCSFSVIKLVTSCCVHVLSLAMVFMYDHEYYVVFQISTSTY